MLKASAAVARAGIDRRDRLRGAMLGGAVGDAIGLPFEGVSRRRVRRMLGDGPLHHRLVLGWGMFSDDTEHACMTAQALLASGGDGQAFTRSLARRLRWWLLGVPAGVGWGTLRAITRLWVGFNPARSGVSSSGNGPAMRAPVLGVWAGPDRARLKVLVRVSTWMTHVDTAALQGAMVTAIAAHHAATHTAADLDVEAMLDDCADAVDFPELRAALEHVREHVRRGDSVEQLADTLGLNDGVTGYMVHTVPVALMAWLTHRGDYRAAIESVVRLGGDTDTVAAITGSLVGALNGENCIPSDWLHGVIDTPRSVGWIRRLADRLADSHPTPTGVDRDASEPPAKPLRLFVPGVLMRNALFAGIVLAHGLRRLLPPY
ncbi:MAG: ADP-ribosylglycohydrolase [Phycisphaera sp.]|nr:ADP-ribosylglycohydrolase [Phycisphaera sp.]